MKQAVFNTVTAAIVRRLVLMYSMSCNLASPVLFVYSVTALRKMEYKSFLMHI